MADTTFGSCCADEVAAMHVDAQCIVHYGHTCLSRTSRLPVWFVFGRAIINAESCATCIVEFAAGNKQPVLVMFGLKYIHAVRTIQKKVAASQGQDLNIAFIDTPSQLMKPTLASNAHEQVCVVLKQNSTSPEQDTILKDNCCQSGNVDDLYGQCPNNSSETCQSTSDGARQSQADHVCTFSLEGSEYRVGGLKWVVPQGGRIEEYIILWIGDDDPGLTNISLIFNSSTVVRYDTLEEKILTDVASQSRLLQRRYYLVERAKDANVVGIVVGTLGVAGYGEAIQNIRKMIEAAGKKAYTLVMGKPNPSKLANFPECEVFVLVACPQTALLDSKEYLAPLITPFEAELAFLEGRQWTGAYSLDFGTKPATHPTADQGIEPRFSLLTGSYVGKDHSQDADVEDGSSRAVVLSRASQHALQLQAESSSSIITTERSVLDIKSGAEYLASRTYQGLDINREGPQGPAKASQVVVGLQGRAAGYINETMDDSKINSR